MNRIDTYARAIRNDFRWDRIKAKAASEGNVFLGTVFSLTPSGKFYAPFACSNVMGCRRCKGTGKVKNRRADEVKYAALDVECDATLRAFWQEHGMAVAWPSEVKARIDALRAERDQFVETRTCTWCDGMCSHEAAQDQDWNIALEQVAEKHGLYVYGPEGSDGCDVWLTDPRSPVFAELNEDEDEDADAGEE